MTSDQQIPEPQNHDEAGEAPDQGEPTEAATPGAERPFGFWLKLVDRRLSEEIERVLAEDGLTRRDWRMLNVLADTARDEHLAAKLEAKPGLVHALAERGWVEGTPPSLTTEGREALDRLTKRVGVVRARVAGAVSPEDFATTVATLEAIARELGWDESQPLSRGRRGGRGFGRRHGRFHGHPHEHGRPHEHGHPHEHCNPRDHGRGRDRGQQAHPGLGRDFDPAAHGNLHGHGADERFEPRERFGASRGFGHGPRRPRQDVHVHVHMHDGHRRLHHDA